MRLAMAEAVTDPNERVHAAKMTFVVLALAAGFALVPRAVRSCEAGNNETASDFTANVIANKEVAGGEKLTLSALRGKPVVLDFWATWCGPCQMTAPIVNTVSQRYRDKGLVVIGVNVDDDTFPV